MIPPAAVLLDIEGTVTRIAFVHDVLFPYARARLPALLRDRAADPAVATQLAAVAALAPGQAPLAALLGWMDADAKVTPLKALQGLIWADGYACGELRGELYPDVASSLRRWSAAGMRLYVYSSGSVGAQRLIFGHSTDGDLTPLFAGFFDTQVGSKREAASYDAIARGIALPPGEVLFLSDLAPELDAAAAAGLRTCQVLRPEDGTRPTPVHPGATDLPAVAQLCGLPGLAG